MHRRVSLVALAWIAAIAFSAAAAESLEDLLRAVETAAALTAPVRADGSIEIDGIRGKSQDRVVILARAAPSPGAPAQVFVDFQSAKLRALALAPGDLHVAANGAVKAATPGEALVPTSFTAEDLLSFSRSRCAAMRIADISNDQFTLVCEPAKKTSQYALAVYKFDRAKSVPLQVLLYKDGMTNLVKMQRWESYAQAGASWLPTRVVMQDFKLRTKDVLTLEWKPAPAAPAAAFDATSFAAAPLPAAPR